MIADRDPKVTRREIRMQLAAGQAIAAALHGLDAGIVQAFDAFEAEADPLGLPAAVRELLVWLVAPDDRELVSRATAAMIADWRESPCASPVFKPGDDPAKVVRLQRGSTELAVWRVCSVAVRALTDVDVENLRERLGAVVLEAFYECESSDPHYEDRLRRIACWHALAALTGATGLHSLAHRLARAENHRRPWLPLLHVYDRVGPIIDRQAQPIDRDALIADLKAELNLLTAVPHLEERNDG